MLCIHSPGLLCMVSLSTINRTQLWKTDYLDDGSPITVILDLVDMRVPLLLTSTPRVYLNLYLDPDFMHPPRPYRFPLIFRPYWIFSIYQPVKACRLRLAASRRIEILDSGPSYFTEFSYFYSPKGCVLPFSFYPTLDYLHTGVIYITYCRHLVWSRVVHAHWFYNPTMNQILLRPHWTVVRAAGFHYNSG